MSDHGKDDDEPLDEWWEDELLEEPDDLVPEDEGNPSDDEEFGDDDALLAPDEPLDAAWDESELADEGDDLPVDDELLAPEILDWGDWTDEEPDESEQHEPAPPPRPFSWVSPLRFVAAVRAPEPLVVGYRVLVDLPEHELRGLAGRCHTQRAISILRAKVLRAGPDGAELEVGDQPIRLQAADAEGQAFLARLRVNGRELEGKLSLMHSEAPPRIYLGRDLLAIGQLLVDVTRADS